MKTKIIICSIVLLLAAFTGDVFGGTEGAINTFYGHLAGNSTSGDNDYDTFIGAYAGYSNTTGFNNTFLGNVAGYSNTTGASNIFLGYDAGYSNTTGADNIFLGTFAGYSNTTGASNTFLGNAAGYYNTTSAGNTFVGESAGYYNTTGNDNIFLGFGAGFSNTEGNYNIFIGNLTGYSNTTGFSNTFLGEEAGYSNTTGYWNTFLGLGAGYNNTTGYNNTFVGKEAGVNNTTGSGNVFLGFQAGLGETGSNKLYIDNSGFTPLIYGEFDNNIVKINGFLGVGTAPLYAGDVSAGGVSESQLHFSMSGTDTGGWLTSVLDNNFFVSSGAAYINGQWVQKSPDGNAVMAGSGGVGYRVFTASGTTVGDAIAPENLAVRLHLDYSGHMGINTPADPSVAIDTGTGAYLSLGGVWTSMSSREAKEDIKDLSTGEALEALNGLNPVKFAYKADPGERHVGFIAEDVPQLVATKDRKGLSPMDFVAVITKVVQEQHKTNQEQQAVIKVLTEKLAQLEAKIEDLQARGNPLSIFSQK